LKELMGTEICVFLDWENEICVTGTGNEKTQK
jgi:hypothetical protein